MDYFLKNNNLKDFLITILFFLAMAVVIFSFIGVSEAASSNNDVANNGVVSKNFKVKSITISNNTVGGIKGAVGKSKSGTTIYLKKGIYSFNNINIKVNKTLTIVGKGSAKYVVIDARSKGNIFKIAKNGNLTLINITLINADSYYGGAIYNNGTVYIKNSVLKGNFYNSGFKNGGGAIYNVGRANIISTTFSNNYAAFDGGAIYNKGYINIKYSSFLNNHVSREGGAIYNKGAVNIHSTFFKGNYVWYDGYGGAISNIGNITVKNSLFKGNNAKYQGGALYNWGNAKVLRSTFKKNFAYYGEAIYNNDKLILYKSKFKDNKYSENKYDEYSFIDFNKKDLYENNPAVLNEGYGRIIAKYNDISGSEIGFYSNSTKYCLFRNNKLHSLKTGIFIEGNNAKVDSNKIYDCFDGILIKGYKNLISNNTIIKSKYKHGIVDSKKSKSNKIFNNKIGKFIIDNKSLTLIKKSSSKKSHTLMHWKAHGSSKSVTIYKYYSKGEHKTNVEKIRIEKIAKNKLKISSRGVVKYVKTKNSPRYYYLKIYKPKMLKNTIKKGIFGNGSGYIPYESYSVKSSWKAKINREKIVIYEYCNGFGFSKNNNSSIETDRFKRTVLIEKCGNGLKFTTTIKYIKSSKYALNKNFKDTYYIKNSLNPLEYYLKVYKPTITKNSRYTPKSVIRQMNIFSSWLHNGHCCISLTYSIVNATADYSIGDLYYIKGIFNNSNTTVSWNISHPVNGTIIIEKNYSNSKTNENFTTKIEVFELNILKITMSYLDGDIKVDFIETNLSSEDYFQEIIKDEINNELKKLVNISINSFGVPWFPQLIIFHDVNNYAINL